MCYIVIQEAWERCLEDIILAFLFISRHNLGPCNVLDEFIYISHNQKFDISFFKVEFMLQFFPLCRVAREGKERRRLWAQRKTAQRKTPRPSKEVESNEDVTEDEKEENADVKHGMLPSDIVQWLAAREKYDGTPSLQFPAFFGMEWGSGLGTQALFLIYRF